MWCWESTLDTIEEISSGAVIFTRLESVEKDDILGNCPDHNAVVIHCGTLVPMANMRRTLLEIRQRNPKLKIGLETNCSFPGVQDLVDFYVVKPTEPEYLLELLEETVDSN